MPEKLAEKLLLGQYFFAVNFLSRYTRLMTDKLSLRERKKIQTGREIWMTAVDLFIQRGFDAVSVKEIADAAQVSKMTVFNYFPTKEDLVMGPMAAHVDEPARVVRDRPAGQTPHGAFREHFLAALAAFDPATGLCDQPHVLAVQRMIRETPALLMRALAYTMDGERLLARQLVEAEGADETVAKVMAAQILGVRDTLVAMNHEAMVAGIGAAEALPAAVRSAETAFGMLADGLGEMFPKD